MKHVEPGTIRLYPEDHATISGLSQGIARALQINTWLVRSVWLGLYVLASDISDAISSGVPADGLVGWVYLFFLLTGGSPVLSFYLFAWAFTPQANGQRTVRPLLWWALLFFGPLLLMAGLIMLGS